MQYLRNSQEIKNQLSSLFSQEGEKWAVVGFVGYNALDHLPACISNLSVVCWPKAGGTNPDGVRRLIDHGIAVYFCDRLHHKIYWRKNAGLIVGSANLSENALGEAGLHEFAVYCDDKEFDIRQVLEDLCYAQVTSEALAKLDIDHAAQTRQGDKSNIGTPHKAPTFLESIRTKHPKKWKLVAWYGHRESNDHIQAEVETRFRTGGDWENDNDVESGSFQIGDIVLQIRTNDKGIIDYANARWLFVDHIVGKRGTRTLVQVYKSNNRTPPPFELDSTFKKHLKEALNSAEDWDDVYDPDHIVRPSFIRAISDLYK